MSTTRRKYARRLPPEQRREQLLDAALSLIPAGFDTVTMESVAKQAQVTKPVLYDLFANRAKVFYQASTEPGLGKLDFDAKVPLTPGNNLIEIYAREGDEVIATRRMWVLRTSGLAEARAKEASFTSNGKLAVDTFQK